MCDSGVSDSRAFAHEPFFSIFFFQYSRLVLAFRKVVGLAFGHLFLFVFVLTYVVHGYLVLCENLVSSLLLQ